MESMFPKSIYPLTLKNNFQNTMNIKSEKIISGQNEIFKNFIKDKGSLMRTGIIRFKCKLFIISSRIVAVCCLLVIIWFLSMYIPSLILFL
jgi:hypothetical protein